MGLVLTERCAGSQPQKGIITYTISANRSRPLAGTLNAAVFNLWRRFRGQVLYVAPPFVIAYLVADWAQKKYVSFSLSFYRNLSELLLKIGALIRNEYYNSKKGIHELGLAETSLKG